MPEHFVYFWGDFRWSRLITYFYISTLFICTIVRKQTIIFYFTEKNRHTPFIYLKKWNNVSIGHRCPRFQLTRGIIPEWKNQSCQELNLAFFIPDLVLKFKIICYLKKHATQFPLSIYLLEKFLTKYINTF